LASFKDDKLHLTGMLCSVKHKSIMKASHMGNPLCPEDLGYQLAAKMIENGALDIINEDLYI
jgi:hypothetical protein